MGKTNSQSEHEKKSGTSLPPKCYESDNLGCYICLLLSDHGSSNKKEQSEGSK